MILAAFYKGTRPGLAAIYSVGVRMIDRGPYSHCELVFSDGVSASASFIDDGVRFKRIDYDPANWDFLEIPDPTGAIERFARAWFEKHKGYKYALIGNLHFILGFLRDSETRKFCSEALAASLGLSDAWRYGPNGLYALLRDVLTAIANTPPETPL